MRYWGHIQCVSSPVLFSMNQFQPLGTRWPLHQQLGEGEGEGGRESCTSGCMAPTSPGFFCWPMFSSRSWVWIFEAQQPLCGPHSRLSGWIKNNRSVSLFVFQQQEPQWNLHPRQKTTTCGQDSAGQVPGGSQWPRQASGGHSWISTWCARQMDAGDPVGIAGGWTSEQSRTSITSQGWTASTLGKMGERISPLDLKGWYSQIPKHILITLIILLVRIGQTCCF